jgi:hypothetical protein
VSSSRTLLPDINYLGEYWNVINSWLASIKNKNNFAKILKRSEILSPFVFDTVFVNLKSREIAAKVKLRRNQSCGYLDHKENLQGIVM